MLAGGMFAICNFYLLFAVSFAVPVCGTAARVFDLPTWASVLVFIVAHGVSLVPFLRGALVLWVAWQFLPWYGAIPAAMGVCAVRAFISNALWTREKLRKARAGW